MLCTSPPYELPLLRLEKQIWETMLAKEDTLKVAECLAKHEVKPDHRAKMVGWMVEVLSELGSPTQTLFLSVRYMDLYFSRHEDTLPLSHLHLVGATAMLLASKFDGVLPIPMQTLEEDIVHKSFSADSLREFELRMLKTLEFDLDIPTMLDFLGFLCEKLSVERAVVHCAVSVGIITQISYSCLNYNPSQQGTASLIVAALSTRQYSLVSQVLEATGLMEHDLLPLVEWMHSNAVPQTVTLQGLLF
jgi:hypothetical protein